MFELSLFGYLWSGYDGYINKPHERKPELEVAEIARMIVRLEDRDKVLQAIDALTLDELNKSFDTQPYKSYEQFEARASLLRFVHEWLASKYNAKAAAKYPDLVEYLIKLGAKSDIIYSTHLEQEASKMCLDAKDRREYRVGNYALTSSVRFHIKQYMQWLEREDRGLHKMGEAIYANHIANIKRLINALEPGEIDKPLWATLDLPLLHIACSYGMKEIAEHLIELGANIEKIQWIGCG